MPLDRTDPHSISIAIDYVFLPASGTSAPIGTIVAQEGGPGYSSNGSLSLYIGLFRPLLATRNLIVVDARGTGLSTTINCPALQAYNGSELAPQFQSLIAECGASLNHRWQRSDGSYVHASDLFGTANAADDLAAVLTALGTGPVDLYGDSYGTFFSQTFASRYPGMLRSLTLDGSYPTLNANPWYPSTMIALRAAFDIACARSQSCDAAAPGPSMSRIATLLDRLRRAPLTGWTKTPDGTPIYERVTPAVLAGLANSAGADAGVYRDLDAASRAYLDGNDPTPLLRLTAQTTINGDLAGGYPAFAYSVGLAIAAQCTDYPQIYEMRATPAERLAQYNRSVANALASYFTPFTVQEWIGSGDEGFTNCLNWPTPVHDERPVVIHPPLVPPTVPVLILNSELDSVTPLGGAKQVLAQMGPSARMVSFPNTTHVAAEGDPFHCASSLVDNFVADPQTLWRLDTSCTDDIPELRAVGAFPATLSRQVPGTALPGNQADTRMLRLGATGVEAAGDVLAHVAYLTTFHGVGLRGGDYHVSTSGPVQTVTLRGIRWTSDATTDGTVTNNLQTGVVTATLRIHSDTGSSVVLDTGWDGYRPHSLAHASGTATENNGSPIVVRFVIAAP